MSAHLVVPAIDDVPATLSRAQLTGLLRDELGFTGTIVTDALEMKAVSATVGMEEGAVQALLAGADALCLGHDIDEGHVGARPRRRSSPRCARDGSTRAGSRRRPAASRRRHVPVAAARAPTRRRSPSSASRRRGARSASGRPSATHGRCCRRPRGHDLGRGRAPVARPRVDPRRAGRRRRGDPHHGEPARPGARGRRSATPAAGRSSSSATSTAIRGSGDAAAAILAADRRRSSSTSATRPASPPALNGRITTFGVRARQPHGRGRAAARRSVTSYGAAEPTARTAAS